MHSTTCTSRCACMCAARAAAACRAGAATVWCRGVR